MRIPEKTILVTETTSGMAEDGFCKAAAALCTAQGASVCRSRFIPDKS
jgi:hypothetical protein